MIICSAIKTFTGEILKGRRHADIIHVMHECDVYRGTVNQKETIQGFLDDNGNFLNRVDARKHFLKCGQISIRDNMHPTLLFSEDLY